MENKLFKISGLFWKYDLTASLYQNNTLLDGPFCPKCKGEMDADFEAYSCLICSYKYEYINGNKFNTEEIVKRKFDAALLNDYEIISLDEPPTHVKASDSDDNYFISAKIGQKDGKKVGVVYFGENMNKQSKEDYSQIFIDLDDEQLRFDKSNKHPKNVLCKFKAEFPDVIVEQKFKNNN